MSLVNRPADFWTDETSNVRQRTFTFWHSADGQTHARRTVGLEEENFMPTSKTSEFVSVNQTQGRIKTKLGLMLLPGKGPIFFSAFKADQEIQEP